MNYKTIFLMPCLLMGFLSCTSDNEDPITPPPVPKEVTTVLDSIPATDCLSVDKDGNIYISNFGNYVGEEILKINPTTGTTEVHVDGLRGPTGNKIDDNGNIFISHNVRWASAERKNLLGDVLHVDKDGNRKVLATLPGYPAGIALDKQGNAYVANYSHPGIHKITPSGEVSIYAQDSLLQGCVGIALDENGILYAGNFITGNVFSIDQAQSIKKIATIPTKVQNWVIGYITYYDGNIYATAAGENVIYKINTTSGSTSILAGDGQRLSKDGTFTAASFSQPNGITVDPNKKVIYVSEARESYGTIRSIPL